MKKRLFILGIISFVACVLSLSFAVLNLYGYYHVMDGSAELYSRLYQRMTMGFVGGALLAVAGALCMIFRTKK